MLKGNQDKNPIYKIIHGNLIKHTRNCIDLPTVSSQLLKY